jgi:plastocyanin
MLRRATRSAALLVLAVAGTAALAGCGDTTADDEAAGCNPGDGETVTVEIPEFSFDPNPVRIAACDAVVWENTHTQAHTSTGQGDLQWSTGNLAPGESSEPVRFDEAGELTYICALHPFMEGVVEVA